MSATELPPDTGGIDLAALARGERLPDYASALGETRRQLEICNACRYCESYCAVFPAMAQRRAFSSGDLAYLANLCHNCRGCYYACQYTPPHEFAVNLPRALAEVRHLSWAEYAWPTPLAQAFRRNGLVLALALAFGIAAILLLAALATGDSSRSAGFYAVISHTAIVALFGPVFLLALVAMGMSLARFWRATASPSADAGAVSAAVVDVATMKNLSGGHGEGCNYENEDEFTQVRRRYHQATLWGFLLCFASTVSGTILHYVLALPAPYGFWSLPKLLGIPGGILLCVGTAGLFALKLRSDPLLDARELNGIDTGFTVLLFLTGLTGLLLYVLRDTPLLTLMLALHLGAVLALFATLPYSKMVHGLYRLAALVRSAKDTRTAPPASGGEGG